MADRGSPGTGPAVVALGGGHGLAVALRAVRTYAGSITAVVSVADDGGSSGRLRRDLGVPPPGDLRRCLGALGAPGNVWVEAFEYRFQGGELDGHALGNLVLVGLAETTGTFTSALDEAARMVGAVGQVRPATTERVTLKARVGDAARGEASVEGQVAVGTTTARIRRVELVPGDVPAHPDAVAALAGADQVVLAPGSLYTSLLSVLSVTELRDAVAATPAQVVQIANLRPQVPETEGFTATDHLRAVREHGGRVDVFLADADGALGYLPDHAEVRALGARPDVAAVAGPNGLVHDPRRLARTLRDLLESYT